MIPPTTAEMPSEPIQTTTIPRRPVLHTPLTCLPPYTPVVRVLVVEDEPRMATLLERGLREEGYAVDVAADGTDGLWLATENDYDAIVLDVLLPGHRRPRGLPPAPRRRERWAPVLLLTARDGSTTGCAVWTPGPTTT